MVKQSRKPEKATQTRPYFQKKTNKANNYADNNIHTATNITNKVRSDHVPCIRRSLGVVNTKNDNQQHPTASNFFTDTPVSESTEAEDDNSSLESFPSLCSSIKIKERDEEREPDIPAPLSLDGNILQCNPKHWEERKRNDETYSRRSQIHSDTKIFVPVPQPY